MTLVFDMNVTIYTRFMLELGCTSVRVCGNFYMAVSLDRHLYDNFALFGPSLHIHVCRTTVALARMLLFFLERK